ncbi:aldehyde dehydrogenase family protein [Siminovitchia terrae]
MTLSTKVKGREMYLAGKWVGSDRTTEVLNPQDNSLITTVPAATAEDMLFAIEEAKKGAKIAANMPVYLRMSIINKAADYIKERSEAYAVTISQEGSKTINEARNEVKRCIQTLRLSAEEARRINGETIPFDQSENGENRVGYFYRFPIGVIGAITPFNDPLNLVAHKIGPAIASGNAIIVKPATMTPLSALLLAKAFDYAGLPETILSVVTGSGRDVGDVLVTHPGVRMISFTGGLETGESIARKAGLKKLSMELGSNSPAIVLKDADIKEAVDACVSGAYSAAGQNCIGVQRILIEEEVYDDFKSSFLQKTALYKYGDKSLETTDMGPLINEKEAIRIETWVNEAIDMGAELLVGGKREGAFYSPTVLEDVPDACTIAREEIFGPVVLLYSVPDLQSAIKRSNDVNFGLHAGIFTKDIEKAFSAIHQLNVGGIMINDSGDYRIDGMPFGGVKGSGLGREGIKFAIQDMTEPKVVSFKLQNVRTQL